MIDHEKIKHILELSNKLGNNPDKIIEMMQHHTSEIKELHNNKDKHFAIETGDLIILAIQLLMMEGYSTKEIMNTCYNRFDKKLNGLLEKNVN
jgi:hypothetical protein|tara:strand:- start:815 stop:1093 length:279 start_codon:yes stop_codon:yes gene_type:complete